jgi:prostaglandin reductase 1
MGSRIANMLARKFVLANKIKGAPKLTDFKLVEETLPTELQDGEILAKAEWLTVDPYMRVRSVNIMQIGDQMPGGQVARVLKSRCPEFPEGSQVVGNFGWRDLTIYKVDPTGPRANSTITKMPDMKGLPDSYALGCMGMPGNTAYFGLLDICKPKAGETLVVSAAAGAVGSLVGQIGKIKGLTVIGFAGSEDKLKWMKNDLGFDAALNYKTTKDLDATFKAVCPQGIDCYFDNVGGEFIYHVIHNMNEYGRISQCGSLSTYNAIRDPNSLIMEPFDYPNFRNTQIKLEGFNVRRWQNQWFEGIHQIRDWILDGKLKVQETVADGFEKMPQAFIDLLDGKNIGKQIIKA